MDFSMAWHTSLVIFALGTAYKIGTWFSRKIGCNTQHITISTRVAAAAKGVLKTLFSAKIAIILKVVILDVLLQHRVWKEDFGRWLMHMLIYGGFLLLFFMHALESQITAVLFDDYYSTVNPFLFLRNLFGLMVVAGVGVAMVRRFIKKVPRLKTNAMDGYAMVILIIIMASGFLLEGMKITSHTAYQQMVDEYAGLDDEEEIQALESFWVQHYGTVSPDLKAPFENDVLEMGKELHEDSCVECHASPQWAFAGWGTAKLIRPFSLFLDGLEMADLLWHIHYLACFLGLAYLPFSKMFHIFATPVSLMVNAVTDETSSDPANLLTQRIIELDACMRCGTCSLRCSAAAAFDAVGNSCILPSEKMTLLKSMAAGKKLIPEKIEAIREGIYLCTNCDRCTVVCPAGINLKELWFTVREELVQRGDPEPMMLSPFSFYRALNRNRIDDKRYGLPIDTTQKAVAGEFSQMVRQPEPYRITAGDTNNIETLPSEKTFAFCFGCQTCTTVCPVVADYEMPMDALGLLPHQIMNCLGLGLTEMASGPRMLWDCTTCYLCQEHCPQQVEVTDILFQLKNLAVTNFKKETVSAPPE